MKSTEQREYEWKRKRHGKITASTLPDLMKKGRGKDEPFGKAALDAMYIIRYERRTGITRESPTGKALDWGHENEPLAIEWIQSALIGKEIKSCTTDFEDIVFNEPFDGFGDSPDFYVYDSDGNLIALGEIKCPMSQTKIETLQFQREIDEKDEYYWQFLGHFLGRPDVDKLYYVIYDGYSDTAQLLSMNRADHHANIERLRHRIMLCNEIINLSLKLKRDLPECIDTGMQIVDIRMQIEALMPDKKSVPVANKIYRLKQEIKRIIKAA